LVLFRNRETWWQTKGNRKMKTMPKKKGAQAVGRWDVRKEEEAQ